MSSCRGCRSLAALETARAREREGEGEKEGKKKMKSCDKFRKKVYANVTDIMDTDEM